MNITNHSHQILDWTNLDLYQRIEFGGRISHLSKSKNDSEEFCKRLIDRKHFSPLEFARIQFDNVSENVRRIREEYLQNHQYTEQIVWLKEFYPALVCDIPLDEEISNIVRNTSRTYKSIRIDNSYIPVLVNTSRHISHQLVRYRYQISFMQESQRYCKYNEIEYISPIGMNEEQYEIFNETIAFIEAQYKKLIDTGLSAQIARNILPNATKTTLLIYASKQAYNNIFRDRCSSHADPAMQVLMVPIYEEFKQKNLI